MNAFPPGAKQKRNGGRGGRVEKREKEREKGGNGGGWAGGGFDVTMSLNELIEMELNSDVDAF